MTQGGEDPTDSPLWHN